MECAHEMILSSPPSEVVDVYNDLVLLSVPADSILPSVDTYHSQTHSLTSDSSLMLTKFNKEPSQPCTYSNYRDGSLFTVDPLTLTSTPTPGLGKTGNELVQSHIDAYVVKWYANGAGAALHTENGVVVCLVNNLANPANFWNGRWTSEFSWSNGNVSGWVKLAVHYYEDGNVQLDVFQTLPETGATDVAQLIGVIGSFEQKIQNTVGEEYARLNDRVFKGLRRALPVFRTRIKWETISGCKFVFLFDAFVDKIKNELNKVNA